MTVADLFERIEGAMPGDQPGTLKRTEIADVMALILRVNGLPAGPRALPSGKTALTLIGMESAQ